MGEKLDLFVLGKPAVYLADRPITEKLAVKEQAMLYYLAVTGETHTRHALAGLFWGDSTEQKAKTSLRVALSGLRKKCPDHLVVTHSTVAFDPTTPYQLDVNDLEQAHQILAENENNQTDIPLAHLEAVANLYRGNFLQDFFVEGTPAFEEWQLSQRAFYQQLALQGLVKFANYLMSHRNFSKALDILGQWLTIEPWDEAAHRKMMLAQSRLGNFNAALAQYEQCREVLETELGVVPMQETTALYERIQLARQSRPFTLPADDTPLVGRQKELDQLHQLLAKPDCRLVTITGLGGAGKTRLALAAARQANREGAVDYLNGVVFVPLASLTAGSLVPFALADALELFLSGQSDPFSDVLNYLSGREMLLVFDNFEQLLDGVRVLNRILERCPAVKLLVTSREPLQLAAEWRLTLEGLSYPAKAETELDPKTVAEYEAVQLFIQAARQVRPNFQLTEENTTLIQQLCSLVDGIPLALRLSATWLRAMSFNDIVNEVERGLDILETSMRDVPERQRSIRVIFTQAWSLLSEAERKVLPALSVFRGGFDSEAVTAVSGAKPWLLAGLVDRGLLQLAVQNDRYAFHELTRQFAAEMLDEAGDRAIVAERHSQYYLGLMAQNDPAVIGAMRQSDVNTLRPDFDNIRQAWHWALAATQIDWLERSMNALAAYYEVTGLFEEAIDLFKNTADRLDQPETAENNPFITTICRLLVKQLEFLQLRGDYDLANQVGDRILEKASGKEMVRFQADVHRELGIASRWAGKIKLAEQKLRKATTIYEELNAEWPLATTLDWLGLLVSDSGKLDEALLHLKRAAKLHAKVNNQRGLVFNKGQTAVVLVVAGRLMESLAYQLEVLDEYTAMGYPLYISRTANNIGLISIELGEYESGLPYMEHALELQRQTGALLDIYNTLGNKGELHMNLGQYRQARHCFEEAVRFFDEEKAVLLAGENLWRLGKVFLEIGEYDLAEISLERCRAMVSIDIDVETFAFATGLLAQVHWRQGDTKQAGIYFEEAAVSYDQVRRPLGLAEFVHIPKVMFQLEHGDVSEAALAAEEMESWIENAGRNPVIFMQKFLTAKITHAQGEQAEARQQLERLLEGGFRSEEQAMVYYTLWEMTEDSAYGRKAQKIYQEISAKTPKAIYAERLEKLKEKA